jgi:hypothetical protein
MIVLMDVRQSEQVLLSKNAVVECNHVFKATRLINKNTTTVNVNIMSQ